MITQETEAKPEIRWYKGKYRVEVVLKSKGNCRVRALGYIEIPDEWEEAFAIVQKGDEFTTVPRLLWRHPRKLNVQSYKRKPKGGKRKVVQVKAHERAWK